MIAIVDYGVGNLFSLKSSFGAIGAEVVVTADGETIRRADKLILPGVGAFGDAAALLEQTGLGRVVREQAEAGKPLLGICLGMQLLFEESEEYGRHRGYKVPHIGWNALHFPKGRPADPLFRYVREGECVYFVHSYYAADCDQSVIATAEYGPELTAAVRRGNVMGTQFHPEKSGNVGLNILRAFCDMEVGV